MLSNQSLTFAILITAPPLHSGSETAFQFIEAALRKNLRINRIFFYQAGVYHGSRLIYLENPLLLERWQNLAKHHGIELVLCSASSVKRGILGAEEAVYFERDTHNLADGFQIAGLSVWFESLLSAQRTMIFGDGL